MNPEPKSSIRDWTGGKIRVYRQEGEVGSDGKLELVRRSDEERGFPRSEYVPFGPGYAMPTPLATSVDVPGHGEVWLHVGLREGRACCVGITSADLDPRDTAKRDPHDESPGAEITQSLVRALSIPKEVTNVIRYTAVELFIDDDGEIAGESIFNREGLSDRRSWKELSAGAAAAHEQHRRGRRRGRQPLSPEALREVARTYNDGQRLGVSYVRLLVERWPGTNTATARGWVRACRTRIDPETAETYLPPRKEQHG